MKKPKFEFSVFHDIDGKNCITAWIVEVGQNNE